MRALFALILVTSVSWSVFWLWGALSYKANINEWISNRQIEGWQVKIEDITLFGYPNRFDITLKNLSVFSEDSNLIWGGEFLQILRLSYNKKHTIAVFPKAHHFKSGGIWFDVTSESLRASRVVLRNGKQRIIIEGTTLRLKNEVFDQTFDKAQMALLQTDQHFKFQLTLKNNDEAPIEEWSSLTVYADLFSSVNAQNHDLQFFDLSSLVFANTKVIIDNKNVFEEANPRKFLELLIENGIMLAGNEKL